LISAIDFHRAVPRAARLILGPTNYGLGPIVSFPGRTNRVGSQPEKTPGESAKPL